MDFFYSWLQLEEEKEKQKKDGKLPAGELDSDDEIMAEYLKNRMKELIESRKKTRSVFGRVFELESADEFLEAADHTSKTTLVLVLMYEDKARGCSSMKNALQYLAVEYSTVKFCQIKSSKVRKKNQILRHRKNIQKIKSKWKKFKIHKKKK